MLDPRAAPCLSAACWAGRILTRTSQCSTLRESIVFPGAIANSPPWDQHLPSGAWLLWGAVMWLLQGTEHEDGQGVPTGCSVWGTGARSQSLGRAARAQQTLRAFGCQRRR